MMSDSRAADSVFNPDNSVFTILGGTTIADSAAIIRSDCREGSRVELRRPPGQTRVDVWLECTALLSLIKTWKRIGHVPDETAMLIPTSRGTEESSTTIGHGIVKSVYAPVGRDEAVVTVQIQPASSP